VVTGSAAVNTLAASPGLFPKEETMSLQLLGLMTAGLLLAGANAPDDAAKKDTEKLQGTWKISAVVTPDGKKVTGTDLPDIKLKFEGDKVTQIENGKDGQSFTYKLDPSKKPATYELTGSNGQVQKGIYQIDGDELKYAMEGEGKDAPKDFDAKGIMIMSLKREKAK
jgi:uncharacterized protein (TIGR03067 family)